MFHSSFVHQHQSEMKMKKTGMHRGSAAYSSELSDSDSTSSVNEYNMKQILMRKMVRQFIFPYAGQNGIARFSQAM
jgi:hypothetical protein